MDAAAEQLALLLDLDARHDDLLRRLEELDQRVADTLAEYQTLAMDGARAAPNGGSPQSSLDSSEGGALSVLPEGISEPDVSIPGQGSGVEKKSE